MSGSPGDAERPVTRVEVPGGQGVQVGDHNTQLNQVHRELHRPAGQSSRLPLCPGLWVVGEVPQRAPAFQPRAQLVARLAQAGRESRWCGR